MAGTLAYLDSSALVKLVVAEPETRVLRRFLALVPERASSRIAEVEVVRAIRRTQPARLSAARRVLESVGLVELDAAVFEWAAHIDPPELRTLDALHLATALSLGDDLALLVAYDERLAQAARAAGIEVVAPS